eukprot:6883_1
MLKQPHSLKQRVIFDDDKSLKYDDDIQETTRSITNLFKNTKLKLQKIAFKGNENNSSGFEDRTIRYNAMRSRATKIQEWTKIFRDAQRNYLESLKKKNNNSYFNNFDNETFNTI